MVLNGHLDTVGVEGIAEPFTARIDGDRMFGRGTSDMKGGVAGLVIAEAPGGTAGSAELRCLVCQNESIDNSEAPLARDIRLLIRERIGQGESNDAVRAYLVSRYGDFILLKPPFKPETLLLWLSPVLVLGLGVGAALFAQRRAPRATPRLSAEEEARLAALTDDASSG